MSEIFPPSPAVVVGVDGSYSAVDAALWAIDEAVARDLPLRLLYAIDPPASHTSDSRSMTSDFAKAEAAVRYASMAIESAERPVKLEVEIIHGSCVDALVAASRSAALVCVGARGIDGAHRRRVGPTVAALMARAHCPVAVVRQPTTCPTSKKRCVAVEFDGSPEADAVLERAFEEAHIRALPLWVLAARRPTPPETRDAHEGDDINRNASADLELSVAPFRERYPEVGVRPVAVPGSPVDYVASHVDSIGLLVVGHQLGDELPEFAWPTPPGEANEVNCPVLICERMGAR